MTTPVPSFGSLVPILKRLAEQSKDDERGEQARLRPWFDLFRHEGEDDAAKAAAEAEAAAKAAEEAAAEAAKAKFSQADLDRIVKDRLAKEKAKVADYEDLKKAKAKLDELEAASKGELEREKDRATKAEERAVKAEALARSTAIRAAAVAAAAEAGAIKPDDVIAHLAENSITVNDDGTVDGAAEAVKAVLDARPHWVNPTKPQGSADQGARGGTPPDFTKASPEELARELASHGLRPRST